MKLIKLYKAGGLYRIIQEILNLFFDLNSGVETRKRKIYNSNEFFDYMPSYKKTVTNALLYLKKNYQLKHYNFLDIGCGKGKTMILASKYSFKQITGYEIDKDVFSVLKKNINQKKFRNFKVYNKSIKISEIENNSVIYFYNPFNEELSKRLFDEISINTLLEDIILIYVNPIYSFALEKAGWKLLSSSKVSTQKTEIWKL